MKSWHNSISPAISVVHLFYDQYNNNNNVGKEKKDQVYVNNEDNDDYDKDIDYDR